jgi:hypothetical protein
MAMLVALEAVALLGWGVAALVRLGRRMRAST